MKLKHLHMMLEDVEPFERPKVELEQYVTMPHIASHALYTMQATYGDVEGRLVADLGCGCGSLAIGAMALGAAFCVGFDIDPEALQVMKTNCDQLEVATQ